VVGLEVLTAPGYAEARWLFVRGVGLVYALAFVNVLHQWRPLLGQAGLTPAGEFVARVPFRRAPSLFHWRSSDRVVVVVAALGLGLSLAVLAGVVQRLPVAGYLAAWVVLYLLYLSFVNVGQRWYGFGWETLTLEAGVLAGLLGPERVAPPLLAVLLVRWLLLRVELGAGLIKLRGDRCWRDLTCLEYHHETQPMPNGLSWRAHHLPRWWHRTEVAGNHVVQLALPLLLFLPQPFAGVAGVAMLVTQGWLVLSGNFAWLNLTTMLLALLALPGAWLAPVVPDLPTVTAAGPLWWVGLVVTATAATAVASRHPVRNLLSPRQAMNTSYNPWRLVGSYGAFGSVTRERHELLLEWTAVDPAVAGADDWHTYHVPGKPTDVSRRPPRVAPYHLRLGWLLWFAAMSPRPRDPWLVDLAAALLRADPRITPLVRGAPPDPPRAVRVRRARYRFTTPEERRATGDWWARSEPRAFLGPATAPPDEHGGSVGAPAPDPDRSR
jgi:hypothetical protein